MSFKDIPIRVMDGFYNVMVAIGEIVALTLETGYNLFLPPYRVRHILNQMIMLGVKSFPIIAITALFSGMVMAYQFVLQLRQFGAEIYVGAVSGLAIVRELGPVFTSLMVAGRVSAGITAELGSMVVTEQIDALRTSAINPVEYLVVPRFIALIITLPVLTILANSIGYLGTYLISVQVLNVNAALFFDRTLYIVETSDIYAGLIKTLFFAAAIAIIGCHNGFKTKDGATGVGKAVLISVVTSCILIFIGDYILTALMFTF